MMALLVDACTCDRQATRDVRAYGIQCDGLMGSLLSFREHGKLMRTASNLIDGQLDIVCIYGLMLRPDANWMCATLMAGLCTLQVLKKHDVDRPKDGHGMTWALLVCKVGCCKVQRCCWLEQHGILFFLWGEMGGSQRP